MADALATAGDGWSRARRTLRAAIAPFVGLLVVVGIFVASQWFLGREKPFLTPQRLSLVAKQSAIVGMGSLGMTVIIIAGGIDLSAGSLLALHAVLLAYSEGGAMGALFTATYPERVERLILLSSMARFSWAPDYPHRPTIEQILQHTAATWGKPEAARHFAPSRIGDAAFAEALARYQRQSTSPSAIKRLHIANDQIDVRAILPQVRRPTLILHRRRDRLAVQRRHPGQRGVEDAAQRVDVAARVDRIAAQMLWRHEVDGSDPAAGVGHAGRVAFDVGDAEVDVVDYRR